MMIVRMMLMRPFDSAQGDTVVHQFLRDFFQMHMTHGTTGIGLISFVAFAKHRAKIVSDFAFETLGKIGFGVGLRFISMIFPFFYRNEEHITNGTSSRLEIEFFTFAFHWTIIDGTWRDLIGMRFVVTMMIVMIHFR